MIAAWLLPLLLVAADPATACREAYEGLRYREAADACLAAAPGAEGPSLAELYRLAGLSLAAIGDAEQARSAFVSLLAVLPGATLGAEISPRLRAPFDEARRRGAGAPVRLAATPRAAPRVGEPLRLTLTVEDGPAHPVERIVARSPLGEQGTARTAGSTVLELGPPRAAGALAVDVGALDRFGGRLAGAHLALDVLPASAPAAAPALAAPPRVPPVAPASRPRPPPRASGLWKGLALAAVGVAAGGVVLALLSSRAAGAASDAVFADDAARQRDTARTTAVAAYVTLGVATALGGGAAALWATSSPAEEGAP